MTKYDPSTVRRLIERDLVEWADDSSLRLVWADLLQLEGDPLGRLVVLDHVAEIGEGAAARQASAEAELLRAELSRRLWKQDLPRAILANRGVELRWSLGFVRELVITASKLSIAGTPTPKTSYWRRRQRTTQLTRLDTMAWIMPHLLSQPALQWVEVIRVIVPDAQAEPWLRWAHERAHCATLREIHVGEPAQLRERPSGAWESGRGRGGGQDHSRLGARFRRLRWLSVAGEMIRLPCREGSTQTRTHHARKLATRPLTSPNCASLARGLWDASVNVHQASFETARALGPRAAFLLDDLIWFLRPPISKKDPRPVEALDTLAAIGPASAPLLAELLDDPTPALETHARRGALMRWLAALGAAAQPARSLIDAVLAEPPKAIPKALRTAAKRARKQLDASRQVPAQPAQPAQID